jgi:hypothetical protein
MRKIIRSPEELEIHKAKIRSYKFNHRLENRDHILEYRKAYTKRRVLEDPSYKIAGNLRHRLFQFFKRSKRPGSHIKDLGCSIEEFKVYISLKFTDGMSWENYGKDGWHLDHIIPLSKFNLSNIEDFKKACHFSNLQPLWKVDNMKKGNKIL